MPENPQPIDVRRYDAIVELLTRHPETSFPEVARQLGVSASTVQKIWDGSISRPPIVVLERLAKPRRCRECGALCVEWPCVLCEMQRRGGNPGSPRRPMRFVYKRQTK